MLRCEARGISRLGRACLPRLQRISETSDLLIQGYQLCRDCLIWGDHVGHLDQRSAYTIPSRNFSTTAGEIRCVDSRKERATLAVFGKILGSAAGFAIGGPLGAIAGLALGHVVDKRGRSPEVRPKAGSRAGPWSRSKVDVQTAFAVAFVTLAAKLSKTDGRVTRDEIDALKRVVSFPEEARAEVGAIFDAAKVDATGFEPYARQIAAIVRNDLVMLEQILAGLVQIAAADGTYHSGERDFINRIAREFRFSPEQRKRIEHTYLPAAVADEESPYEVLGVSRDATDDEVRNAYRRIVKDFHPDKLVAKGMPEEFHKLGAKRTSEANIAYDQIKKERRLS